MKLKCNKKLNKNFNNPPNTHKGFTLVELMVAMFLGLVVAGAAISALLVSRSGFVGVDAANQLQDNIRFSTDFVRRLAVQSGFKDVAYVDGVGSGASAANFAVAGANTSPPPPIEGFNNQSVASINNPTDLLPVMQGSPTGTHGSDSLILRFQTSAVLSGGASTKNDGAMFNCLGATNRDAIPANPTDRMTNVLYVGIDPANAEPTLYCQYQTYDVPSKTWQWVSTPQPLVSGVESFQILYGTDAVVPNAITTSPLAALPTRYLRADEMVVPGNTVATNDNWRRVRSLRIGMVLHGALNTAADNTTPKFLPLGAWDVPSQYDSSQAEKDERRLRRVVTFTVYLHNVDLK